MISVNQSETSERFVLGSGPSSGLVGAEGVVVIVAGAARLVSGFWLPAGDPELECVFEFLAECGRPDFGNPKRNPRIAPEKKLLPAQRRHVDKERIDEKKAAATRKIRAKTRRPKIVATSTRVLLAPRLL